MRNYLLHNFLQENNDAAVYRALLCLLCENTHISSQPSRSLLPKRQTHLGRGGLISRLITAAPSAWRSLWPEHCCAHTVSLRVFFCYREFWLC